MTVANIGPRERRKRLYSGVLFLGVAIVLTVSLRRPGVAPAWRLTTFVPLLVAAVGYFQARDKT